MVPPATTGVSFFPKLTTEEMIEKIRKNTLISNITTPPPTASSGTVLPLSQR